MKIYRNSIFFFTQLLVTFFFMCVVFSNAALAQDCTDVHDPRCAGGSTYTPITPTNPDPLDPFGGPGPDVSDTAGGGSGDDSGGGGAGDSGGSTVTLFDPVDMSIEEIFLSILDIITVFAIPIILFFIVWAGFLYVTAAGDASKVQKATVALTYAVVGALLVLGARIILAVITNTINTFSGS